MSVPLFCPKMHAPVSKLVEVQMALHHTQFFFLYIVIFIYILHNNK